MNDTGHGERSPGAAGVVIGVLDGGARRGGRPGAASAGQALPAVEAARRALSANPLAPEAHRGLIRAAARAGLWNAALEQLRVSAAVLPWDHDRPPDAAVGRAPGPPRPGPGSVSVALNAFRNLTGDPARDSLVAQLTEHLADCLCRCSDRVLPADARTADASTAHYVVEGSVQGRGGKLRVTAHLVEPGTGTVLWSGRWGQAAITPPGAAPRLADRIWDEVLVTLAARPAAP